MSAIASDRRPGQHARRGGSSRVFQMSDEEPDPLRKRARELGFELQPRRPARVD